MHLAHTRQRVMQPSLQSLEHRRADTGAGEPQEQGGVVQADARRHGPPSRVDGLRIAPSWSDPQSPLGNAPPEDLWVLARRRRGDQLGLTGGYFGRN